MYVCICKAVTEDQIRDAVQSGCDSVQKIQDHLGVIYNCGKCAEQVAELIGEYSEGEKECSGYEQFFVVN